VLANRNESRDSSRDIRNRASYPDFIECTLGSLYGENVTSKNSDASSRFYHKSIAYTSQSILRQHIQAIKQLQRCKCATMLARNTARSRHAGAYGDHGPEICCATPGPNNCTERDQNRREPHERKTDARIHPILMCGLRGVAELSAAQGRGELLKRHHTR
jgi:hypothetical protein